MLDLDTIENELQFASGGNMFTEKLIGLIPDLIQRIRQLEDKPLSDPEIPTLGQFGHNSPSTSRDAAVAVFPRTGTQRGRIIHLLSQFDYIGFTDEEMGRHLKLELNTIRPRRGELVAGGWVKDSGYRRYTMAQQEAIVWVLTDAAIERLKQE